MGGGLTTIFKNVAREDCDFQYIILQFYKLININGFSTTSKSYANHFEKLKIVIRRDPFTLRNSVGK